MNNQNRVVGMETKITNVLLVEAIRRMKAEETPETRNAVVDETVRNAKFLMPVYIKDGSMQFHMVTNKEKQNYFVAFTDWEEMKPCIQNADQKAMIMTFDDYALLEKKNTQTAGFVINPFTSNLIFKKDYVLELMDKKIELLTKR